MEGERQRQKDIERQGDIHIYIQRETDIKRLGEGETESKESLLRDNTFREKIRKNRTMLGEFRITVVYKIYGKSKRDIQIETEREKEREEERERKRERGRERERKKEKKEIQTERESEGKRE